VSLDALHVAAMPLLLPLRHCSASVQAVIIDRANQIDRLPQFNHLDSCTFLREHSLLCSVIVQRGFVSSGPLNGTS
jgi:hypothetical protein